MSHLLKLIDFGLKCAVEITVELTDLLLIDL